MLQEHADGVKTRRLAQIGRYLRQFMAVLRLMFRFDEASGQ
jgi:hypothetical protein